MGIVASFLLVTIGIVGVLVYRFDHILWQEKMSSLESDERSQASALSQSVAGDLRVLSESFSLMAKEIKNMPTEFSPVSPLGAAFCKDGRCAEMLAVLHLNGDGLWTFGRVGYLEKSQVMSWAENYLALVIKDQSHLTDTKVGDVFLFPLQNPDRQTFIMAISPQTVEGGVVWFGALFAGDFFQSLVDVNKGASHQTILVTNSGYALAHSLPEYIGQNFENDPIVKELMHTSAYSGSGVFADSGSDQKHGVYEQVPHSNLYFVISTPMQNLVHMRSEKRIELGLLGLAIASIGFGFLLYLNPGRSAGPSPSHVASVTSASLPPLPVRTSTVEDTANSFVMQAPAPLPPTESYQYSEPVDVVTYAPEAPTGPPPPHHKNVPSTEEDRTQNSPPPRRIAHPENFVEEDDEKTVILEGSSKPVVLNDRELDAALDGEDLIPSRVSARSTPKATSSPKVAANDPQPEATVPQPVAPPPSPRAPLPSMDSTTMAPRPPAFIDPTTPTKLQADALSGAPQPGAPQPAAPQEVKIQYDRPQFKFQKKKSHLDEVGFQIRKPGAKA